MPELATCFEIRHFEDPRSEHKAPTWSDTWAGKMWIGRRQVSRSELNQSINIAQKSFLMFREDENWGEKLCIALINHVSNSPVNWRRKPRFFFHRLKCENNQEPQHWDRRKFKLKLWCKTKHFECCKLSSPWLMLNRLSSFTLPPFYVTHINSP